MAMKVHQNYLDHMVKREGLPLQDNQADFDAEETACPACLTPFRTAGVTRCPECGWNGKVPQGWQPMTKAGFVEECRRQFIVSEMRRIKG